MSRPLQRVKFGAPELKYTSPRGSFHRTLVQQSDPLAECLDSCKQLLYKKQLRKEGGLGRPISVLRGTSIPPSGGHWQRAPYLDIGHICQEDHDRFVKRSSIP